MKKIIGYRFLAILSMFFLLVSGMPAKSQASSVLAGATAATAAMIGGDDSILVQDTPLSGAMLAMYRALNDLVESRTVEDDPEAIPVDIPTPAPEPPEVTLDIPSTLVATVGDYANVRAGASEDTDILGKIYNNCIGTVLGIEGDWVHFQSGNVDGYVRSDFVEIGNEDLIEGATNYRASVTADALKLRSETNTNCSVVDLAWHGEKLDVINDDMLDTGWVAIKRGETDGYVSCEFVDLVYEYDYAETREEEQARRDAENASLGSQVANYALRFVGNPYVWGGTSLTNGADCSGFVMSVYAHFGVSLPHSSAADRGVGRSVPMNFADMRPGDLVCYSGHVALYIGNGKIVHAASREQGIIVSNAFYRNALAVRRIF